ncbi:isochorismatase family protein [Neisseriaceae bacterium ESL0693]|nr:isochorismatase family protein [Neisseriaceae bacterium ESL0693]
MPQTLLQIANAVNKSINWNDCNLLLIDMQNQYFRRELNLKERGQEAVLNAENVLNLARKNKVNIFHVIHVGSDQANLFNCNSDDVNIVNELSPMDGENIIKKTLPNSFYKTDLYELMKLTGKKQVAIMGFASHMCVTATTIAAFELGFDNFVLTDCCATRDLPLFDLTIDADVLHKSAMAALGDRYATLLKSGDVLN